MSEYIPFGFNLQAPESVNHKINQAPGTGSSTPTEASVVVPIDKDALLLKFHHSVLPDTGPFYRFSTKNSKGTWCNEPANSIEGLLKKCKDNNREGKEVWIATAKLY